jgi:hypothetical protein
MVLWLRSCGVLFTSQARRQKRGAAGPGDKSMMEEVWWWRRDMTRTRWNDAI